MKVVIIHPPLYPVNIKHYNALGKLCDLTIYMVGDQTFYHESWNYTNLKKDIKNFKVRVLSTGRISFSKKANPKFIKYFFIDKPDVVLNIAFWLPSLYSVLLKKLFNFKTIIHTDAIEVTENRNSSEFRILYRKLLIKLTDGIIAASSLTKDYFVDFLRSNENKIFESTQTIDTTKWLKEFQKIKSRDFLRQKHNISVSDTILLGVGHLMELKNWQGVFKEIRDFNNIKLFLVGDGDYKEHLVQLAEKLNLNKKIIFAGRKEGKELLEYYKLSDIFIFPTLSDTFGFVVPEALISGLPVLCSLDAGASSLIKNGYNGYVIDPDKDYSNELNKIINNLEEMKINAYYSMKNSTIERRAQEFYDIFCKVLNK